MVPFRVCLWSLRGRRKSSVENKNTGPHLTQATASADVSSLSCYFSCVQWQIHQGKTVHPPELRVEMLVFKSCLSLRLYKWILWRFVNYISRKLRKARWGGAWVLIFFFFLIYNFPFGRWLKNLINIINQKKAKQMLHKNSRCTLLTFGMDSRAIFTSLVLFISCLLIYGSENIFNLCMH